MINKSINYEIMRDIQSKIEITKKRIRRRRLGRLKKKVLLCLIAGANLALATRPWKKFQILEGFKKEWRFINKTRLKEIISDFYNERLIDFKEENDGTITVALLDQEKIRRLSFDFVKIKIKKPEKWDGKWRLVIFDIPESKKGARDSFRQKLKGLGFHELQKSVFVHPFECGDEIDFLIEVFELRPYVKQAVLTNLTNELELREIFGF